jgi:hypothetical protein
MKPLFTSASMGMRTIFIAGIVLAALSGPAGAETREISGFDNVSASGRFRVEVAVGPEFSLIVEGSDAARVRTRREGDTLKIEPVSRPWFGNPRYDAIVHVIVPRLEGVAAARGATLNASAGGECTEFSAAAAMGAELRVSDIQCERVDAAAAMGANVTLAGSCGALDVSAAMGADVSAANLHCRTVNASAAMGADIEAFASNTFDAAASMGADVAVSGGGKRGDTSAAMGGSITHD